MLVISLFLHGIGQAEDKAPFSRDLRRESTETLRLDAEVSTKKGDWNAAFFPLQELVRRFGDLKDPENLEKLEGLYFDLGVAASVVGKADAAIEAFNEYLKKFPKGRRVREAMEMLADAYTEAGTFRKAALIWLRISKEFRLSPEEIITVKSNIADNFIAARSWAEAKRVLLDILDQGRDPGVRNKATVLLVQTYIELGQPSKILSMLPSIALMTSGLKYDVVFNQTLIRGGDKFLAGGDPGMALLLYRSAFTKEAILEANAKESERLASVQKESLANRQPTIVVAAAKALRKNETERRVIEQIPSYTEELRMRTAKVFFDRGQKWEALWAFYDIYRDFPNTIFSEDALYSAFLLSGELLNSNRAEDLARLFLEKFPNSARSRGICLQLAHILVDKGLLPDALALLNAALLSKDNDAAANREELLFLYGYALLQDEQFPASLEQFETARKEFPESSRRDMLDYWIGMAQLFLKDYEKASVEFQNVSSRHTASSRLIEDATFRLAVCEYGKLNFPEAEKAFASFFEKFPHSPLAPEAHMFMGDIAAADGRMDAALGEYRTVVRTTKKKELVDNSVFQIGKIFEGRGDFSAMAEHFRKYISDYGEKGDYTEAVYRLGYALRQLGDNQGMLDAYANAISRFGSDRNAFGVDSMLNDWPEEYRAIKGDYPRDELQRLWATAHENRGRTMELRLQRIFDQCGILLEVPAEFTAGDLEASPPAVLLWAARKKDTDPEIARQALLRIESKYSATEWMPEALMDLAAQDVAKGNAAAAAERYHKVQELCAGSLLAGQSLKMEAEMLMKHGDFTAAVTLLEKVLATNEYNKGPIFPEVLYLLGECQLGLKNPFDAAAYFERIYVLYSGYPEWTAKAYLRRGLILQQQNSPNLAVEVYREMSQQPDLKTFPEYAEAMTHWKEIGL